MRDQVQRQSGVASFADEVALEEAAARDEVVLAGPCEQGDAALDRDQAGVVAAGQDLGGQVDQLGVFAPGSEGEGEVPCNVPKPITRGVSGGFVTFL